MLFLQFVSHFGLCQSGSNVKILEPLFHFQQAFLKTVLQLGALFTKA